MTKKLILSLILFGSVNAFSQLTITNLKCEYRTDPLGVDDVKPRLSWELQSPQKNILQTAYRILVADDPSLLNNNKANVWDSKKMKSTSSIQVPYNGKPLKASKKYYWKVMVWDNKRRFSTSDGAFWQMGLLAKEDWNDARWIAYEVLPEDKKIVPFVHMGGPAEWGKRENTPPLFRKEFSVAKPVKSATAFISGLGHFEMFVNGKKIGNNFIDPGWTQYSKHALYVTFDITKQLQQGGNAVGVMLGNGFFYIPGERYRKLTGGFGYPKMIAKIAIEYADGSIENIVTDRSWKTAPSPITFSSIYGGEDYNANLEQNGWDAAQFDENSWRPATETTGPKLDAQMAEPVRKFDVITPVKIKKLGDKKWFFDLGQNFAGIPFIALSGKKGDTVRIIPGELIFDDFMPDQRASGGPHYYQYILKGEGSEYWEPKFTYYGFRYLVVEGATTEKGDNSAPFIEKIGGIHIHNAASKFGNFSNSFDLFNKTNKLIEWAMTSNMVSVFTDCPHREKLGWLEEYHLMGSSLRYNYDIAALCKKVMRDVLYAQTQEGLIPDIAPEYVHFDGGFRDSPEWGSTGIIMPWYMYEWYGDKEVLVQSYDMMKRYIDHLASKADNHIISHGLGDWVDIGPAPPGESQLTPKGVTATAIYYYNLNILGKTASLLGKSEDAAKYKQIALSVKESFNKKFFNPETKQYATGSQAANAMAIYMQLVEPQHKEAVLQNLIADIRKKNLTAGDVGYRYVLRALQDAGRSDVIYDMNSNPDVPGYGYQLKKGATSLVESWDALPGVSQNHFMLGHIMEWFYSGLAGIRQAKDGIAYKKIEIRPAPVGEIKFAKASYHSPYGLIKSEWERNSNSFILNVTIPANTTATVYFPPEYKKAPVSIGSGNYKYVLNKR